MCFEGCYCGYEYMCCLNSLMKDWFVCVRRTSVITGPAVVAIIKSPEVEGRAAEEDENKAAALRETAQKLRSIMNEDGSGSGIRRRQSSSSSTFSSSSSKSSSSSSSSSISRERGKKSSRSKSSN